MAKGRCSVDGCDREHTARGMCRTHYNQWHRTIRPTEQVCDIGGCDRPHHGRGWCRYHHQRFLRHGDPEAPVVRNALTDRDPDRPCVDCGDLMVAPTKARKRCSGCAEEANRARRREAVRRYREEGPQTGPLTCRKCGGEFPRPVRRGRPPSVCSPCREAPATAPTAADPPAWLQEETRRCDVCGNEFVATTTFESVCSEACRRFTDPRTVLVSRVPWRECATCGEWFVFHGRAHCQRPEPVIVPDRPCDWCGTTIPAPKLNQRFCSGCGDKRWAWGQSCSVFYAECGGCGVLFTARASNAGYCNPRCRPWDTGSWWITPARRMAIYERDRWRCQLCGGRVGRYERDPQHDRAPSLDHIVPRSQGGTDDDANLQLAHRECNGMKGTAAANEQLRLVG